VHRQDKMVQWTNPQCNQLFRMPSPGCKFPLLFLNSLLGCSGCMGSGIVMMKQYPSCHLAWTFLRTASRSVNRTWQCDAGITFSPRFWKCANSIPWESHNKVSITFLADGVLVTLNFLVDEKVK
jgi:hypothetical protein